MLARQAVMLAEYNRWMNEKLYAVCTELDDAERKRDRGAFFGSIHATLNHLLLADRVWFGRFSGEPFSVRSLDQELYADFAELRAARAELDVHIERWAKSFGDTELAGELRYISIIDQQARVLDFSLCVTHFFNHQTHHRGQITALLSQAGKRYGVTDLIAMPGALKPA